MAAGRPRVLLVDRNEAIRGIVARALSRIDCAVLEADDADAARALCATRPLLAAAIVDLDLPDGSGVGLVEQLSALLGDHAPPFIVFAHEKPRPRPVGVVAVVEKSAGIRALLPLVTDFVSSFRNRGGAERPRTRSSPAPIPRSAPSPAPEPRETLPGRPRVFHPPSDVAPPRAGTAYESGPREIAGRRAPPAEPAKRAAGARLVEEVGPERRRDPRREG